MLMILKNASRHDGFNAGFLIYPATCCAGLNKEQNALVDLLVLVNSSRFVGFAPSTFSYFIREYRALYGLTKESSYLVKVHSINSEVLFNATAILF